MQARRRRGRALVRGAEQAELMAAAATAEG